MGAGPPLRYVAAGASASADRETAGEAALGEVAADLVGGQLLGHAAGHRQAAEQLLRGAVLLLLLGGAQRVVLFGEEPVRGVRELAGGACGDVLCLTGQFGRARGKVLGEVLDRRVLHGPSGGVGEGADRLGGVGGGGDTRARGDKGGSESGDAEALLGSLLHQ